MREHYCIAPQHLVGLHSWSPRPFYRTYAQWDVARVETAKRPSVQLAQMRATFLALQAQARLWREPVA
jgi:hypothetical protein